MKRKDKLRRELEALLLAAGYPLPVKKMGEVLTGYSLRLIKEALASLTAEYEGRVLELAKVAGGYVFHVREDYADIVRRLNEEKPPRYSRALMETLAIIAYKQPITRAEIEELRGVTLSTHIMRTLTEHEWIHSVGYKEVPGRPLLWGTTKHFLDSFKMESLASLPPLTAARAADKEEKQNSPLNIDEV